jgi:transcriptional regulator NrdR family protein
LVDTTLPVSLRKLILENTGQDVRRCRDCAACNNNLTDFQVVELMDISLDSMIHMILWNDDEVLTSRTIWSDPLLKAAVHACVQGLSLDAVIRELRREAHRRGLNGKEAPE